jgi:organic radical activating enzyme
VIPETQTKYHISALQYLVQREGVTAGVPRLIVNFAPDSNGQSFTALDVVEQLDALSTACRSVLFRGNEPALQVDEPLLDAIRDSGRTTEIETSGTVALVLLFQWITMCPRTAEHTIRQKVANEVRYVRSLGQAIPKPAVTADHYVIVPAMMRASVDEATVQWCEKLVLENPRWRLSPSFGGLNEVSLEQDPRGWRYP